MPDDSKTIPGWECAFRKRKYVSPRGKICSSGMHTAGPYDHCGDPGSRLAGSAVGQDIPSGSGNVQITLPVSAGQVIVPDILQTGSDIIATRDLP